MSVFARPTRLPRAEWRSACGSGQHLHAAVRMPDYTESRCQSLGQITPFVAFSTNRCRSGVGPTDSPRPYCRPRRQRSSARTPVSSAGAACPRPFEKAVAQLGPAVPARRRRRRRAAARRSKRAGTPGAAARGARAWRHRDAGRAARGPAATRGQRSGAPSDPNFGTQPGRVRAVTHSGIRRPSARHDYLPESRPSRLESRPAGFESLESAWRAGPDGTDDSDLDIRVIRVKPTVTVIPGFRVKPADADGPESPTCGESNHPSHHQAIRVILFIRVTRPRARFLPRLRRSPQRRGGGPGPASRACWAGPPEPVQQRR